MTEMAKIERIEVPVPFPPGSSNCYFIPDSTPTLVDTGINTPEALRCLEDGLRKFGASICDIGRIILTHGHSDHAGSVGTVAAASNAQVFVHYRDKRWTLAGGEEASKENEEFFLRFFEETGVPGEIAEKNTMRIVSRFRKHFSPIAGLELLKGGELFSFDHFKLTVIHTPGHTAGSICLFDQTGGLLLSGDCLIAGVIPYICAEPENTEGLQPYYGLEQYERSLDALAGLPVRQVLPGHGETFSGHLQLIERVKRYRARRRQRISEILSTHGQESKVSGMTPFEVAHRLFSKSSIGGGIFMVISEVRGCLETMEKEGSVAGAVSCGKLIYRPNCGQPFTEETGHRPNRERKRTIRI